jgi:hypothetical protein
MAELSFHPEIYGELQEAYSWYEQQAVGLGDDSSANWSLLSNR